MNVGRVIRYRFSSGGRRGKRSLLERINAKDMRVVLIAGPQEVIGEGGALGGECRGGCDGAECAGRRGESEGGKR